MELLADDVWEAEDYKTGFFIIGVDNFDRLFFQKQPISLPMVQISNKKRKYEKNQQIEIWYIFMNNQNIMFDLPPSYEKTRNIKKGNELILMNV